MATPLKEVYDFFLSKVTDYSFINLEEEGVLDDILLQHLRSAIIRFNSCTKDLSINIANQEIASNLNDNEKEILSTLMVLNYISGKVLDVKNTQPVLTDKEYVRYSSANHLDKLTNVKKDIQSEASHLMSEYSLKNGLDDLKWLRNMDWLKKKTFWHI